MHRKNNLSNQTRQPKTQFNIRVDMPPHAVPSQNQNSTANSPGASVPILTVGNSCRGDDKNKHATINLQPFVKKSV